MRRIVLSFSLTLALALLLTLSAVPAFAATSSTQHAARTNTATVGPCFTSPSEKNCDGYDPVAEGCSSIGYLQGGDPWYLKVYWAFNVNGNPRECDSNWGAAWAPNDEYTQMVWLEMKDGRTLYYCTVTAIDDGPCLQIVKNGWLTAEIPNGYQSWYTDMLYGRYTQARVYEMWSPNSNNLNGYSTGYSNWH